MADCSFCEMLDFEKKWNADHNRIEKDPDERLRYEYFAALDVRSWKRSKTKKDAVSTKLTGYKLNYCPECGRALRKGKT